MGDRKHKSIKPYHVVEAGSSLFAFATKSCRSSFYFDETRILGIIDEQGVDYLVSDSFSDKALRYLNPLIAEHPERFSLLFQNGTSTIYRVER